MFSAYLKLEQHQTIKKDGTETKTPRYVVVAQVGYYRALEELKNPNGQTVFFLNETRGVISSTDQRRADRFLMGKESLNFSSVFMAGFGDKSTLIAYGNPNSKKTYGKKNKPNPFWECKNDGYLFLITPDWKTIEVLIIPDGKFTIFGNAKELVDGNYNEALETMRRAAKPELP